MSKKKGLSLEEKRSKMLEIFFEKKDFFQLKDLERMAPKEKGITAQSVKDVLQSLVDDALVDTDKIGTSIYFWAFPSKTSQNRRRKLEELRGRLKEMQAKKEELHILLTKAKLGKEETKERMETLSELSTTQETLCKVQAELEKYKESDPEVLHQQQKEAEAALQAANRWTDNVFVIKSWVKNKFNFEESMLDKQFEIPPDFDYLE